jgi:hypothetical protein
MFAPQLMFDSCRDFRRKQGGPSNQGIRMNAASFSGDWRPGPEQEKD